MFKTRLNLLSLTLTVFSLQCCVHCDPCSDVESLNITDGGHESNGSIFHNDIEYVSGTWYQREIDGEMNLFGCPCIHRVCLWKCCDDGKAFFGRTCNESDTPFNPQLFKGNTPVTTQAADRFFFMHAIPCEGRYLLDSSAAGVEMYLQENGTLYEIANNRQQWHSPPMFCMDMLMRDSMVQMAAVCYPEENPDPDSPVLHVAYAIGMLLSVPFLLATFLVYAFIPELRNLHGMCLMSYCAGLMIAYVFLAYLKLHTGQIGVAMTGCLIVAFIVYYAFQSSFFWLNVMCFDIWRTFSSYRGGGANKTRDKRRYAMYAGYAWGMPLILIGVTLTMQLQDNLPSNIIRPGIGDTRCWFQNWCSELVYFYTPFLMLVILNTVLFGVTANRIRSIRQETAILKSSESARSDRLKKDKQRYVLYMKLFIVMGVNWSVEIISFIIGGPNWYWVVVDFSNITLGVFIFIIFVWKKKVRSLVRMKLGMTTLDVTSMNRTSTAPTEDTRISTDDNAVRMKELN